MALFKNNAFISVASIEAAAKGEGEIADAARKYVLLGEVTRAKTSPTILELGTRSGISTRVFLDAAAAIGGRVYSVDIEDCSAVVNDPQWTFIQSDSTDVAKIIASAPELTEGVDVLFIDSLHTRAHVEKELRAWYPFMKANSTMLLDDVDPFVYRKGSRKDNYAQEIIIQDIQDLVVEVCRANSLDMRLRLHCVSTGLAVIDKTSPLRNALKIPARSIYRDRSCAYRLRGKLAGLRGSLSSVLRGRL